MQPTFRALKYLRKCRQGPLNCNWSQIDDSVGIIIVVKWSADVIFVDNLINKIIVKVHGDRSVLFPNEVSPTPFPEDDLGNEPDTNDMEGFHWRYILFNDDDTT